MMIGRIIASETDIPPGVVNVVSPSKTERSERLLSNLGYATDSLNILDQALGEGTDLLNEAKSLALSQVSTGTTAELLAGQALFDVVSDPRRPFVSCSGVPYGCVVTSPVSGSYTITRPSWYVSRSSVSNTVSSLMMRQRSARCSNVFLKN